MLTNLLRRAQSLQFAKSKSDSVAKLDGTWRKDKSTRVAHAGSAMEGEGRSLRALCIARLPFTPFLTCIFGRRRPTSRAPSTWHNNDCAHASSRLGPAESCLVR
jgi:hypothetical protein